MIEYVFKPVRMRKGRRVESGLYSGRYSLGRGQKPVTVALHVTDKRAAQAKLRALVVEKEREAAGVIAPQGLREAAAVPVVDLIGAYEAALGALGRNAQHVGDTCMRLRRMASGIGWRRLSDVRPDTFVAWLARLNRSAKTRKEYQVSANAFLRWLVKTDQLPHNPLARLDMVETRGKGVRLSRSLSREEIARLLSVAGSRRLLYLTLLYTGMRRGEAASLRWSDVVNLRAAHPFILLRAEETKGKRKRPIPLHPALVRELLAHADSLAGKASDGDSLVFPVVSRASVLRSDLRRAGISYKDASGRVLHFHALRKTFQTLGVVSGVNQRSAQALLGHSDPSLTAEVYTDVAALELHSEVAKLPDLSAAQDAQKAPKIAQIRPFRAVLAELIQAAQVVLGQEKTPSVEGVEKWWTLQDSKRKTLVR